MKRKINIKIMKNGSYVIEGTLKDGFVSEQYFEYSRDEAIALFKEKYNLK